MLERVSKNSWSQRKVKHTKADKLQEILHQNGNPTESFKKLRDNKSLVVLSKSNFPLEVLQTFFHSICGSEIMDETLQYIAITGFEGKGLAVKMDAEHLLKKSSQKVVSPFLSEFLQCEHEEDIKNISLPEKTTKNSKQNKPWYSPHF